MHGNSGPRIAAQTTNQTSTRHHSPQPTGDLPFTSIGFPPLLSNFSKYDNCVDSNTNQRSFQLRGEGVRLRKRALHSGTGRLKPNLEKVVHRSLFGIYLDSVYLLMSTEGTFAPGFLEQEAFHECAVVLFWSGREKSRNSKQIKEQTEELSLHNPNNPPLYSLSERNPSKENNGRHNSVPYM